MALRQKPRFSRVVGWALLLLVALPALYLGYQRMTIPRYKGETAEYWLEQTRNFREPHARELANEAFRSLGPKAAPFLVREYRARLSSHGLRRKLMANGKLARHVYQNEHRLPEWLRNWLTGRDLVGRWTVQRYLADLGTNLVVVERDLAGLLQARHPDEVVEVLNLLNLIGPAAWKSSPKVARLLHHENPRVRNQAAWTMGSLARGGDPHAGVVQIAAKERRIRAAVGVRTLDRMKASPVPLFPELGEQLLDPGEQMEAIACIGPLGREKELLIPELRRALRAKDPQFRLRVVRVLGSIHHDADALEALRNALADDFYYVKAEAAQCLGRAGLSAQVAVPALQELVQHQHPDVREAAAAALAAVDSPKIPPPETASSGETLPLSTSEN